jgi:hypothetical protein
METTYHLLAKVNRNYSFYYTDRKIKITPRITKRVKITLTNIMKKIDSDIYREKRRSQRWWLVPKTVANDLKKHLWIDGHVC